MKVKNLFKGVGILGAVLVLANAVLPLLKVHAAGELARPTIQKIDVNGWHDGDNPGIQTNTPNFEFNYSDDTLTITDNGLTHYNIAGPGDHYYVGFLVDFGVAVNGKTNYGIEAADKDPDQVARWGSTSPTAFVMWLSEAKNGLTLTFEDAADNTKTRDIKVVFNQVKVNSVSEISTANYVEGVDNAGIKANHGKFNLNFNPNTNTITIIDNGLTGYVNGSTQNHKWVGLLVNLTEKVAGETFEGNSYGIDEDPDYTQATRWGATDNGTTFVMWLGEHRDGQHLVFHSTTDVKKKITLNVVFKESAKVTFNLNGNVYDTKYVVKGEKAEIPGVGTKNGWFTDEAMTSAYDFNTAVNSDITLYAAKKKSSNNGSSSSSSSTTTNTGDTNTGTNNTGAVETGTVDTGTVDTGTNNNEETVNPTDSAAQENGYTKEFNDAYQFAFANGITTMKTIKEAAMEDGLTRIAMAKMLSQYAINVLKKTPDTSKECKFNDVSEELDAQYDHGVTLACQLGIMGVGITDFRPNDPVVRAEFGTALSRLLFGLEDGVEAYYTTHLAKLKAEGIISNDDPTLEELRGYVMLMLMRSAK